MTAMGLTNERALTEIQKLFDKCFDNNSLADRIVYVLSIQYNMIDFADWLHHKIAHYFTGEALADGIEAFAEKRGDLFYRGAIPMHAENFDNPQYALKALVFAISDLETQCKKAIRICAETDDFGFEDYLRKVNESTIVPLLKQVTVLFSQMQAYADTRDVHKFNKDFSAWILPEFR